MHPFQPNQLDLHSADREGLTWEPSATRSPLHTGRFRSEDSWIEISSQPSSSSLHAQANDIITTGLDVRGSRRFHRDTAQQTNATRATSVAGSSQDEYEESESESDRVMNSSIEDIATHGDEDEGDVIATAIGAGSRQVFTPQPNAFSHPPSAGNSRSTPTPSSYFPTVAPTSNSDRLPTNRMVTPQAIANRSIRREHPSITRTRPDHDEALRASLTTLLSCAAAVRPPKEKEVVPLRRPSIQPTTLRLVPEAELDITNRQPKPATKRRSRESSKDRQAKKLRALKTNPTNDEVISPTIMTWMISAGVVLVVSAISFSAGYAWGKEVGRVETEMGLTSGTCGREAMRAGGGLRKLRWSTGTHSARA